MTQPSAEFSTCYKQAQQWRDAVRPFIEEQFRFTCPGREHDFYRSISSTTEYETDTFISLPEELATDLAGDLVTYFTPAEVKWMEYAVIQPVAEDEVEAIEAEVSAREDELFNLISSSNYHDIAPQWGFEAASHGTPALWVDVAHLSQPIHVDVVPPHELLIVPGHLGILDRFRETTVLAAHLPVLFNGSGYNLTEHTLASKITKPGCMVKVCWGFWVDWSDPGNPQWLSEVTVDGKLISPKKQNIGPLAGSCPLLVGRFNPQARKPWGRGPGIKALPDMRVLDKVDETVLSGLDQTLLNTLIYADDGMIDFSDGVVAGTAIPASRGFRQDQIYDLSRNVNVDQGWFTEEKIEDRLRRAFYQDGPRQRGDTPPTASQWLDERRRVQQRLGKPSAPLWSELILPLVQRFELLGVRLGKLPDAITHNGQAISVTPISPLQKAQNQDKVMVARSNLDLAVSVFGEALPQVIDAAATMKKIIKVSGDELTTLASGDQIAAPPPQ